MSQKGRLRFDVELVNWAADCGHFEGCGNALSFEAENTKREG